MALIGPEKRLLETSTFDRAGKTANRLPIVPEMLERY